MDVLRPQLIWIGKRCYRKNPIKEGNQNPEDEDIYIEDNEVSCYNDEACDASDNVEETPSGYRLVMQVPDAFMKFIIGKKGETKKRIETETRTQIIVPKQGSASNDVVINGHDRRGIESAKTRIDVLLESARQRQTFSHFLSIPINSTEVIEKFENFKFDVLRECDGDRGLDASLFQKTPKLHLTIGTLVLLSEKEIRKAEELLLSCDQELLQPILGKERLQVGLEGLEYMNDDPSEVDVLYAKIAPGPACDSLQILVDRIVDKFTSAGIMQREHDKVKLHVTVMNTLMRKDPSGASVPKHQLNGKTLKPRESFDASQILKKFGKTYFGKQTIKSIHLSQRYSTAPDGYYDCVSLLKLPVK